LPAARITGIDEPASACQPDPVDDLLWYARQQAIARLRELMVRSSPDELTTLEVLAMLAVMESADQRVNAPTAPVLQLAGNRK
jgi:hypothetical protein